jgi:hypothetical protein
MKLTATQAALLLKLDRLDRPGQFFDLPPKTSFDTLKSLDGRNLIRVTISLTGAGQVAATVLRQTARKGRRAA